MVGNNIYESFVSEYYEKNSKNGPLLEYSMSNVPIHKMDPGTIMVYVIIFVILAVTV